MSYEKRILNPEEIVKPQDKVSVSIKELDLKKRRIFAAGQSITGKLEKKEKFGLFISLAPGVTGLLPQSKINQSTDRAAFEKLKVGDPVTVTIEEIKFAEKKVSLAPGDAADEQDWHKHTQSASNGFGSLGEKLQKALQSKEKK
jgi:small subunit ribosomal protein S1